jgi:predicted transcriptional regulator
MVKKQFKNVTQLIAVLDVMNPGEFRTLREIEKLTGHPQASVSARLRDLRKPEHGYVVNRRVRAVKGKTMIFEYSVS